MANTPQNERTLGTAHEDKQDRDQHVLQSQQTPGQKQGGDEEE